MSDPQRPVPSISPRRRWLFRLAAATLVPALVLGLLEAGLRLGGYGYDASFFTNSDAGESYRTNPYFGRRFFPPRLAHAPMPVSFPRQKGQNAYRIFVMGGSAALGDPDPAFGFWRILEVMLEETYPGTRFEVINTAMVAINSHVVLPIVRECSRHEPDLFVLYLGNNEVVGPFGPATVFARFSPSLTLIRTGLALKRSRIGQLLENLMQTLLQSEEQAFEKWAGLEMLAENTIRSDDPRLEAVYANLGTNLADIIDIAREAGAHVLVGTVACNLRDCAPFASLHGSDLSPDQKARWEAWYDQGVDEMAAGRHAAAAEAFRRAAELDDGRADLHFRLATCLWELGNFVSARQQFALARDLDALRFRADTRINDIVRQAATLHRGATLVDAAAALAESAAVPHSIPGDEVFYDHVHLRFNGNYLLAKAFFERIVTLLPEDIRRRAQGHEEPPALERCAGRLVLSKADLYRIHARLMPSLSRPPFTRRLNHEEQMRLFRQRMAELQRHVRLPALMEVADDLRAAIENDPQDEILRSRLAGLQQHIDALRSDPPPDAGSEQGVDERGDAAATQHYQ